MGAMADFIATFWPWLSSAVVFFVDVVVTGHVVLNKRDNRAALGWVGLIWFVPLGGALLYVLFGINRIRRKARRMRRRTDGELVRLPVSDPNQTKLESLGTLSQLVGAVTARPVSAGNLIRPLTSGTTAYSEMLDAIASARQTIGLSTYIFDNDRTGRTFVDALAAAVQRGVAVRVLIDDIGLRYTFPSIVRRLRKANVPVARFMPSLLPWRFAYAQLRNHRKLLIVDGRIGFTGGMNIRDGHDVRVNSRHPITDCHFRIDGPVVTDLRAIFADDWQFATRETLVGASWFPTLQPAGNALARGIASGPDDHFETLRMTHLGAIACARLSATIITPYFVPDNDMISALGIAALRGVRVEIIVPERNNLLLVQWAMMSQLGSLLQNGCQIRLSPAPFDHTKLLIVDDAWCLFGSANWDARSLRLNFEFDVECYDPALIRELKPLIDEKIRASRPFTYEEWNRRSLPVKLRDGIARLASPYL
jgi:cardiolipin synthase